MSSSEGPEYSPFFSAMGASAAMVFSGNYKRIISYVNYYLISGAVFFCSLILCVCVHVSQRGDLSHSTSFRAKCEGRPLSWLSWQS